MPQESATCLSLFSISCDSDPVPFSSTVLLNGRLRALLVHYFHACTGSHRITPLVDIHHPTHLMVCETRGIRLCKCFASHLRCSWRTHTTHVYKYSVCIYLFTYAHLCIYTYVHHVSAVALEFLKIGRWNPYTAAASPSTPLQSRRQMLLVSARNFLAIKQPRRSTTSRDTDHGGA